MILNANKINLSMKSESTKNHLNQFQEDCTNFRYNCSEMDTLPGKNNFENECSQIKKTMNLLKP